MTDLNYSVHAKARMSQRGIGRSIVELILTNGTKIGRGRIMLKKRKASMMIRDLKKQLKEHKELKMIRKLINKITHIERSTDKVIVVTDGHLITVYHLTRPIR